MPASARAVSPRPQPTSSTRSPAPTGSMGITAWLCSDSPSTSTCLNFRYLGARIWFQKSTRGEGVTLEERLA